MREPGGLRKIVEALEKLKPRHKWHIKHYGQGNERRLTGRHETASIDVFTYGVADRGASIRIPRQTDKVLHVLVFPIRGGNFLLNHKKDGCGYAEDRRPASNCDPYIVTRLIMETCILGVTGEDSYVPPKK